MAVLVVVLVISVITNLVTIGLLVYRRIAPLDGPGPDAVAAEALDATPRRPHPAGVTRRLISIEILNPIELAGTRGRMAGLAGSIVPGLTRRIVYDQTLKILKAELESQQVVADVRVHTLRPTPPVARTAVTDQVETVDLDAIEDAAEPDQPPKNGPLTG